MAAHETENNNIAETNFLNEQTDEAKAKLIFESTGYPNNSAMQDLPQQFPDVKHLERPDSVQQMTEDVKDTKPQIQTEVFQKINNHKVVQDINNIEEEYVNNNDNAQEYSTIANNSFDMRLNLLIMEIDVVNKFCIKNLIENEQDIGANVYKIEKYIDVISTDLIANNFEKADNELLKAENLSSDLMRKVKEAVLKKAGNKKKDHILVDDIDVPDYRSIVTVRGTKEDVINCILKAQTALNCDKFDRARSLLLKAERIFPTKNARDLLKQVQAAKELKDSTAVVDEVSTVKNVELKPERDNTNVFAADKFMKSYDTDDSKKVEQNLNDANAIDPSLERESNILKRSPVIGSKNLKEAKSKIRRIDEPIIEQTLKGQERLENDKNKTDKRAQNVADRDNSIESDNKVRSREITDILEGTPDFPKCNADSKSINPPSKTKQAEHLISMAQNAIQNKKYEDAINFLNTAEELNATPEAKELLRKISDIRLLPEVNNVHSNCYKFSAEANESNKVEALKCINKAQAAIHDNEYDKAEHFLIKSLRISDTEIAQSLLKTVRDAKVQKNTNITMETETNVDEYVNNYSRNEEINEYNKCVKLTTKAIAEGDLARAERFLIKAIRMNPNDNAIKQLKNIQSVRSSQNSSSVATNSRSVKSVDVKRAKEAEILVKLCVDAKIEGKYDVARYYMERALKQQLNENAKKQLHNVKIEIEHRNISRPQSENNFLIEAQKLLDETQRYLIKSDFEKAEFFLIISWNMYNIPRTTKVHRLFLKTRIDVFENEMAKDTYARRSRNLEVVIESDKLVMAALDKYKDNKFHQAEDILMKALEYYPSLRINLLLDDIRQLKNKRNKNVFQCCTIS